METARVAGTLGHWESLRESGNAGTEGKRAGRSCCCCKDIDSDM